MTMPDTHASPRTSSAAPSSGRSAVLSSAISTKCSATSRSRMCFTHKLTTTKIYKRVAVNQLLQGTFGKVGGNNHCVLAHQPHLPLLAFQRVLRMGDGNKRHHQSLAQEHLILFHVLSGGRDELRYGVNQTGVSQVALWNRREFHGRVRVLWEAGDFLCLLCHFQGPLFRCHRLEEGSVRPARRGRREHLEPGGPLTLAADIGAFPFTRVALRPPRPATHPTSGRLWGLPPSRGPPRPVTASASRAPVCFAETTWLDASVARGTWVDGVSVRDGDGLGCVLEGVVVWDRLECRGFLQAGGWAIAQLRHEAFHKCIEVLACVIDGLVYKGSLDLRRDLIGGRELLFSIDTPSGILLFDQHDVDTRGQCRLHLCDTPLALQHAVGEDEDEVAALPDDLFQVVQVV
mmetsp:Transcript_42661/g.100369  ORF Transcript_42661/g.100369 Transcript_42661/m.100369 type:complete len:403 (-) Transcript_42661:380-1588(-)